MSIKFQNVCSSIPSVSGAVSDGIYNETADAVRINLSCGAVQRRRNINLKEET